MIFTRRKKQLHTVDLSERAANDSLRAAKLMFAKHAAEDDNSKDTVGLALASRKPVVLPRHQNDMKPIRLKTHKHRRGASIINTKPVAREATKVAAQTAAALAHAQLTDMDREWALPLVTTTSVETPKSREDKKVHLKSHTNIQTQKINHESPTAFDGNSFMAKVNKIAQGPDEPLKHLKLPDKRDVATDGLNELSDEKIASSPSIISSNVDVSSFGASISSAENSENKADTSASSKDYTISEKMDSSNTKDSKHNSRRNGDALRSGLHIPPQLPVKSSSASSFLSFDKSNSSTPLNPIKTAKNNDPTYGTVNKLNAGGITYQGTLPDLIPNHVRQSKMEKLKHKFFKHTNNTGESLASGNFGTNTSLVPKVNITHDNEGNAVVVSNQSLKFKKTMRDMHGTQTDSDSNMFRDSADYDDKNGTSDDSFYSNSDEEFDDPSNSRTKKLIKRRTKLKKHLKATGGAYRHMPSLSHHNSHGYTSNDFNEDKPWKSHRDVGFITQEERKRYEGVWVSNKYIGLDLLPWWKYAMQEDSTDIVHIDLPADGLILNVVVEDIWSRSHLSYDLLAQIYNLVDVRHDGTLDRRSFIVGMWLVDQCLYGRKLPRELDQCIWDSVDGYIINSIQPTTRKAIEKNKKKLLKKEIKNIKKDMKKLHL